MIEGKKQGKRQEFRMVGILDDRGSGSALQNAADVPQRLTFAHNLKHELSSCSNGPTLLLRLDNDE